MTFETLRLDRKDSSSDPDLLRNALDAAKQYVLDPRGWFALEGPSRSGKTHLVAAIANAIIDTGKPVKYISALDIPDLVNMSSYRSDDDEVGDLFTPLLSAPMLIIDDLGAHQNPPWIEAKIDQLITHRSNRAMPTVIAIAKSHDELPQRIALKISDADLTHLFALGGSAESAARKPKIPQGMIDRMTFDSFNTNGSPSASVDQKATLALAANAAKSYASAPTGWLYLHGPTGVGKTHLAVAIAGECLKNSLDIAFWSAPDLLDNLRHAYSSSNEASFYDLFEQVRNAEILILDDFGANAMTDWALEKMYQLISFRHDRILPTVITSQYIIWEGADHSQWQRLQGKQQWESIRSRLNDTSVVTERLMAAPDYRNRDQ